MATGSPEQHYVLVTAIGWAILVVLTVASYWLEALYGRNCLRHHLDDKGWVLRKAHWRPLIPFRQVRFDIEIERDGNPAKGEARLGGYWTGPVFSRRVELQLEDA